MSQRKKKLYDLSKRCIIKSIDTERVKDNFWNSYAFNFSGVSSQTQTIIMVQKPLQTNLLHWISEWTKLVAINFKDCTDLLLWEKIVQTISKCPKASNFKSFSQSLEQFFVKVGLNNFGNKIPWTQSRYRVLECQ